MVYAKVTIETESKLMVPRCWEEGDGKVTTKGNVFFPWVDENVLKLIVLIRSVNMIKLLTCMLCIYELYGVSIMLQ